MEVVFFVCLGNKWTFTYSLFKMIWECLIGQSAEITRTANLFPFPPVQRDRESKSFQNADPGVSAHHQACLPIAVKIIMIPPSKINTKGPFRITTTKPDKYHVLLTSRAALTEWKMRTNNKCLLNSCAWLKLKQ